MGAWAIDTFGNDTACDWKGTFLENPGLSVVRSAINAVLDTQRYLDSRAACECLASCEVLARLQGRWGLRNSYSQDLDAWVEANPLEVPQDLKDRAESAIERILGPDSELRALWEEVGRHDAWYADVDDLRARVSG